MPYMYTDINGFWLNFWYMNANNVQAVEYIILTKVCIMFNLSNRIAPMVSSRHTMETLHPT